MAMSIFTGALCSHFDIGHDIQARRRLNDGAYRIIIADHTH